MLKKYSQQETREIKKGSIGTESGTLHFKDYHECYGDLNLWVRKIVEVEEGLEKKLGYREFFNSREGIKLLKDLTHNRYPSFYTFSHVCGGSDKGGSLTDEWFNKKGYELFNERIEGGIYVSSPFNGRAFQHCKRENYSNEIVLDIQKGKKDFHNKVGQTPLFVFGNKNSEFIEFLRKKYSGLVSRENLNKFLSEGKLGKKQICINYPCGEEMAQETFLMDPEEDPENELSNVINIIGSPGWVYARPNVLEQILSPFSKGTVSVKEPEIEGDYPFLFDLPGYADDVDGEYLTVGKSFNSDKEIKQQRSTEKIKPLRWRDAEMMIDMYGLFDEHRKIVFFNQEEIK